MFGDDNDYCKLQVYYGYLHTIENVVMLESTITAKGQTTLPKAVRTALDVQAGDRVRYFILDDKVRIVPLRPVHRLFGLLKYDGPPVTIEDMERGIAEGACED